MTTRSIGRAVAYCVATALGVAISSNNYAKADLITTSPGLPPVGGAYMTASQVHAEFPQAEISFVQHTNFTNIHVTFVADSHVSSGFDEVETFNSVLSGVVTRLGTNSVYIPFELTGPVGVTVYNRATDSDVGTFNTQMSGLDLTGNVAGHSVEIKLDPINPTTGQTSVTNIGGGLYDIHSFFDVFTELSLDSGPFTPQTDGPTRVDLVSPEPGTWIMCIGAGLAMPFYAWRRRKPKQVE